MPSPANPVLDNFNRTAEDPLMATFWTQVSRTNHFITNGTTAFANGLGSTASLRNAATGINNHKDRKILFPHFEHQIVLSKQTQLANDAITKRVIAQCDSRTEVLQHVHRSLNVWIVCFAVSCKSSIFG